MALQPRYLTPDEYLLIERRAEIKSEYVDGVMYAMAGASPNHNIVLSNLITELNLPLRPTPCLVFPSDMKVRIPDRRKYLYPDVSVVCRQPVYADDEKDVLLNPLLVIEILSESTASYDRSRKFLWYQQMESLEEYVLVSQDEPLVETYYRQPDGTWTYTKLDSLDATLTLRSVNCALPLQTVYSKVEFPPRALDDDDSLP